MKMYAVEFHMKSGERYFTKLDEYDLESVKRNLDEPVHEKFLEVECHEFGYRAFMRLNSIEFYTVKELEEE